MAYSWICLEDVPFMSGQVLFFMWTFWLALVLCQALSCGLSVPSKTTLIVVKEIQQYSVYMRYKGPVVRGLIVWGGQGQWCLYWWTKVDNVGRYNQVLSGSQH